MCACHLSCCFFFDDHLTSKECHLDCCDLDEAVLTRQTYKCVLWCRGVNCMCCLSLSLCFLLISIWFLENVIWFVVIWTRRSKHDKLIHVYCAAAGWSWCALCFVSFVANWCSFSFLRISFGLLWCGRIGTHTTNLYMCIVIPRRFSSWTTKCSWSWNHKCPKRSIAQARPTRKRDPIAGDGFYHLLLDLCSSQLVFKGAKEMSIVAGDLFYHLVWGFRILARCF